MCIVGVAASFLLIRTFNALLLGENYARNLGIDIPRARRAIILLSALLTGAVTAYCGPHCLRRAGRCRTSYAIPPAVPTESTATPERCSQGAITLLCADLKQAIFGYMLPINAVTSLIGSIILAVLKNSTAKN